VIAIGGGAFGFIAIGGGAVGFIAIGGGATGYYAIGQKAHGKYALGFNRQDQEAIDVFTKYIPGLRAAVTNPMPVIPLAPTSAEGLNAETQRTQSQEEGRGQKSDTL
jgi:hypothetical protein